MSDDNQHKNNGNDKNNGNVWLVLAVVTTLVLLAAFLFGNSERTLRYPDLISLLQKQAEQQGARMAGADAALDAKASDTASADETSETSNQTPDAKSSDESFASSIVVRLPRRFKGVVHPEKCSAEEGSLQGGGCHLNAASLVARSSWLG